MPSGAVVCLKCNWTSIRSWCFFRKAFGWFLTALLVPFTLWYASVRWDAVQHQQVVQEELQKSQSQLLDSLTDRLEHVITLTDDETHATSRLARGCLPSEEEAEKVQKPTATWC